MATTHPDSTQLTKDGISGTDWMKMGMISIVCLAFRSVGPVYLRLIAYVYSYPYRLSMFCLDLTLLGTCATIQSAQRLAREWRGGSSA